jgi:predicted restriction endonuclease
MSNLPSINPSLERLKVEITEMKRGKRGDHYRPHKIVMLLAVIELADRGLLPENKIYLSDPLLRIFENIFLLVKKKDDLCQPGPPFFHLRTSGFWYHKVRPERQKDYDKLTTTGGGLQMIEEYIEYAYLRQDVYELLQEPTTRRELRLFIASLLNAQ